MNNSTLKKEAEELLNARIMVESGEFQKFIVKPFKDELNKLKDAYDCESLRELATIKGKKQGLMFLLRTLKKLDTDWKNKNLELEQSGEN